MARPIINPAVILCPTETGYIAYDTLGGRVHQLNPAAALLTELCDGKRTHDDVVELARPHLPPGSDEAMRKWLDEGTESEILLDTASRKDAIPDPPSPQELIALADELRDEGQVQAAWLCQQQAVDQCPGDAPMLRALGELAHIVGKRTEAREAYEAYLELSPGDAEVEHLLTSLRDQAPPDRVPEACIEQLYARFSSFYEDNMVDQLGYEGPRHLGAVIDELLGDRKDLSILDLGCGTGLGGLVVSGRTKRLVGVDLSPEMIDHARARNIYSELHVAEVSDWLSKTDEKFDLIMACDTLIYFGDLSQVINPAKRLLKDGGVIAFSVEQADEGQFQLTDNGRYVHHHDHISRVADQAGLTIHNQTEAFIRMEYGDPVTAIYTGLVQ